MPGLNLFTPRHLAQAALADLDGRTRYAWKVPTGAPWQHVELLSDGDLLAFVKDRELLRVAPDSTVRWRVSGRFHHDVTPDPDGGFWAATRRVELVGLPGRTVPVLDDRLARFTDRGELVAEISLSNLFPSFITAERIERIRRWSEKKDILRRLAEPEADEAAVVPPDTPPDVYHLNSIEVVDREIPGVCRPGDLLISIRNIDLVATVDPVTSEVRWTWGPGELDRQHHATLLDADTILIFDNGVRRRWSRAVEVNPATGKIVWQYRGSENRPFFSVSRGSAQRLPNGNTLICETDSGRVFEVTLGGEIVWELRTPLLDQPDPEGTPQRAAYYRVIRFTDPAAPALAALGLDLG
jgi:hypothetical protein